MMKNIKIQLKRLAVFAGTALMAITPDLIGTGTAAVAVGALTLTVSTGDAQAQFGTVRRSSRRTARRTSRRVTRRTTRRIAVLPRGAYPVVIGGGTYYYASGAYWQPMYSGGQTTYVQVIVED